MRGMGSNIAGDVWHGCGGRAEWLRGMGGILVGDGRRGCGEWATQSER